MTTMTDASPEFDTKDTRTEEVVLGVDTHRDEHVAAALSPLGAVIATSAFPTTAAGYEALVNWAQSFGDLQRAGIECTGSYGAGLSRRLQATGVQVIEINLTDRADRRRRGKTDTIDAEAAARAVISGRAQAVAKAANGRVEAIRVLRTARNSAVNAKVKAINQLKAIIVIADPTLRDSLSGLGPNTLIRRCTELTDPHPGTSPAHSAAVTTLRLLAQRITSLQAEADQLHAQMKALVADHAPSLLEQIGVGPDNAAALLIAAGDNPNRIRSEASFAALCGVTPVEASSGQTSPTPGFHSQADRPSSRTSISRLSLSRSSTQTRSAPLWRAVLVRASIAIR